ncbi:hypothetical protein [Christiangramia sp. SM2212]|uniref:Uncharacterized protein n=1 Tax=Christiangramia sediminicola TaxID=3073267 RepID=A0ABU1EPC8_9FLAO|nr:hypothetical protein [Christiangramia sp. SM2212]MDR5590249.1 hypothetical protein [Christiangramia sp. SM2212]
MARTKKKYFGMNLFTGLLLGGVVLAAVKFHEEIKAQLSNIPVVKDWI